jgi:NAD(P)-dependent dehydrogenase (short-subunit alcohol dehydrogenase family)
LTARFTHKTVIVTGAGSGIGRAAAELFATEGAQVLAVDQNPAIHDIFAKAATITPMLADIGDEEAVAEITATAVRRYGGIDVFCANAGITGGLDGIFKQTAEDWAEVLRINLIGPFLAIKYASQVMYEARQQGSIVCTASVAGLRAGAGGAAYSASKAGIINLVQTAAQQLAGSGIRVNAVCPGLVETGMTQPIFDIARSKGRVEQIGALNPLRRPGAAIEIAQAIAFLASDAASYINGHALLVDGGLSASLPFTRAREVGETHV